MDLKIFGSLLLLVGGASLTLTGCAKAMAQPPLADEPTAVELTVYKADFAMVHERRTMTVTQGTNHLRLGEVSQSLDPSSVMFQTPADSEVVGSTYDLGIGSNSNLLQRLAGKQVELIWQSDTGREGDRIHGRLEPAADGGFLIRAGDKIYINPKGTLVAPSDDEVSTMPGLTVQLQCRASSAESLGLSYLTRGMSWSADYVAHLDPARESMRLECWAAVTNQTGVPFRDALVTFVAGEPNRAVVALRHARLLDASGRGGFAAPSVPASAPAQLPEAVGELYEYRAPSRASIGVDQMSRVRMFEGLSVPVRMDYSVRLPDLSAWGYPSPTARISAALALSVDNRKTSGLGFPLPSGPVRVFEGDGDAGRYVGADTLPDLAIDAPASLTLSKVFDVSAEPSVASSRRVDRHTMEKRIRVVVRNGKLQPVKVRIVQGADSRWSFVTGDRPAKIDASTAQWTVSVPAGGQKTLDSTLNLKY